MSLPRILEDESIVSAAGRHDVVRGATDGLNEHSTAEATETPFRYEELTFKWTGYVLEAGAWGARIGGRSRMGLAAEIWHGSTFEMRACGIKTEKLAREFCERMIRERDMEICHRADAVARERAALRTKLSELLGRVESRAAGEVDQAACRTGMKHAAELREVVAWLDARAGIASNGIEGQP